MKYKFFIICFVVSIYAYSQERESLKNTWTADFSTNIGYTNNTGTVGLDYGLGIYYNIIDRVGVSTQLHTYKSLMPWETHYEYASMMWSLSAFGDLFVTNRGNRMRLQLGATYLRAIECTSEMSYKYMEHQGGFVITDFSWYANTLNKIIANARLSYIINFSDNWAMDVNCSLYTGGVSWIWEDPFLDILSLGVSAVYKF